MDQAGQIRRARNALNMTQERLATAAGLSKRTVIRAEKGGTVSKETASALSSVLDTEILAVSAELHRASATTVIPADPLLAGIMARGETILWQGAPDREAWSRVNHPEAWYALYHATSAAGAAMVPVYALCLIRSLEVGNMPGVGFAALCMTLCGWLSVCMALFVSRHRDEFEKMGRTRFIATDHAFYREVSDNREGTGTVRRSSLSSWTTVRERAAYLLWPMARVTEIGDGDAVERVLAVHGLDETIRGIAGNLRSPA